IRCFATSSTGFPCPSLIVFPFSTGICTVCVPLGPFPSSNSHPALTGQRLPWYFSQQKSGELFPLRLRGDIEGQCRRVGGALRKSH
ncbi:hypothetical protein EV426DRAFT_718981, partial [Tirmania nivea]